MFLPTKRFVAKKKEKKKHLATKSFVAKRKSNIWLLNLLKAKEKQPFGY